MCIDYLNAITGYGCRKIQQDRRERLGKKEEFFLANPL